MIIFFYNLALHLYILSMLPKIIYERVRYGKYRLSFKARLGRGFPRIEKGGTSLVWIHAVSLGETKAIVPIIKRLKELPHPPQILLSTATETGYKEGANHEVDYHCFMPLDLPYIISPIINQVKPDLVIVTESDFWLNFQHCSQKKGAQLVLVNGKVSAKSFHRFKRIPFFTKRLFAPFSFLCVQGSLYEKRFLQLGVSEKKIEVSGNIKLDRSVPERQFSRSHLKINENHLLFTLGSTHDPEEKLFLDHYKEWQNNFPHLRIVVAPRHPERFIAVEKILQQKKIPYSLFSQGLGFSDSVKVLLVDKMGLLMNFYSLSDLAFVGGTFLKKVGGHNILEPCFYGVPVIFGPHVHAQPDFLDLIRAYSAGRQISQSTLFSSVNEFLSDGNLRNTVGNAGKKLSRENTGALEKTWDKIYSCLKR